MKILKHDTSPTTSERYTLNTAKKERLGYETSCIPSDLGKHKTSPATSTQFNQTTNKYRPSANERYMLNTATNKQARNNLHSERLGKTQQSLRYQYQIGLVARNARLWSATYQKAVFSDYPRDTFAPASSSFPFNSSASSLTTPSFKSFGAASTRSFASFSPMPSASFTTLIT